MTNREILQEIICILDTALLENTVAQAREQGLCMAFPPEPQMGNCILPAGHPGSHEDKLHNSWMEPKESVTITRKAIREVIRNELDKMTNEGYGDGVDPSIEYDKELNKDPYHNRDVKHNDDELDESTSSTPNWSDAKVSKYGLERNKCVSVTTQKDLKFSTSKQPTVIKSGTKVEVYFSEKIPAYGFIPYENYWYIVGLKNGNTQFNKFTAPPSISTLEKWERDGFCKTVTGEKTEPDGYGSNGAPSWLLVMGVI